MEGRVRREPPPFRPMRVRRVERLTPRLARVTLTGDHVGELAVAQPAASVRVLLPSPEDAGRLVLPAWEGNEFLRADGSRPVIRTLTPWRIDEPTGELDVGVVLHDGGSISDWAAEAQPGWEVAVSGPGRGYVVDPDASSYLVAGDETALPAITQVIEAVPPAVPVQVIVEAGTPSAVMDLPAREATTASWAHLPPGARPGDALVQAVEATALTEGVRVWAAGEAAAVQRIRRFLHDERGLPRSQTNIRGYWKHGRSATGSPD
jgi:NADPH-dependent ferric siderophore reductase